MTDETAARILEARPRAPEHVVFRSFVSETVILNLQTGRYHGVNPIGGRMLDGFKTGATVREVAADLAREFDQPVSEVEQDVVAFCADLEQRGLIVLDERSDG